MRAAHSPTGLLPLLLFAACGGGDLTLPGPGQPATLAIVAGDGQHGTQGQPLTDPLVVQVLDRDQRPVAGTDVAFSFTDSVPGAAVNPGTTATDAQGRASARVQLGSRVGAQAIEALVAMPGQDLRVRFQLTALASAGGGGGRGGGGDESSGAAGASSGGGAGAGSAGAGNGRGSGGGDKSGGGHGSGHGDGHAGGTGHGHGGGNGGQGD